MRIITAKGFQHGVRSDAETAEPVHDRPRIAGKLRHGRLGMNRIEIAAQAIDQGRFRPRAQIAGRVARHHADGIGIEFVGQEKTLAEPSRYINLVR